VYGLVPEQKVSYISLLVTVKDRDELIGTADFKIKFTSKPIVRKPFPNFNLRTGQNFTFVIDPLIYFEHPDKDTMTY